MENNFTFCYLSLAKTHTTETLVAAIDLRHNSSPGISALFKVIRKSTEGLSNARNRTENAKPI